MGGKNEKPTIGWKHYLGVHFVLCLSSIDKLLRIDVDKRVLWEGESEGGRVNVHKPELFDTALPEGGVSGQLDVLTGGPSQMKNDYLNRVLNGAVSAYRGVTSVVLRQAFLGHNPTLRSWAFKVQRIYKMDDGPQWYPEVAGIGDVVKGLGDAAIYIAIDFSEDMGFAETSVAVRAVEHLLTQIKENSSKPNDIYINKWSNSIVDSIIRRDCTPEDYDALIAWSEYEFWMRGYDSPHFDVGVSEVRDFFLGEGYSGSGASFGSTMDYVGAGGDDGAGMKRRIVIFICEGDGSASDLHIASASAELSKLSDLEVFCFTVGTDNASNAQMLDNSASDGVPRIEGAFSSVIWNSVRDVYSEGQEMNPAHILREIILAKDTGGSGDASEMGSTWEVAADLFAVEEFGLSFQWKTTQSKHAFLELVEAHVDAVVYEDRRTGLWEIKAIRDDYDIASLYVVDASSVIEWASLSLPTDATSLYNQVTLTFRDRKKDAPATVTVHNPVRVIQAGGIINKPVSFEGIRTHALAVRVADRELRVASALLRSGMVVLTSLPLGINRGDVIVLQEPRFGFENLAVRITEINDGDGVDNAIEVHWIEDKFALRSVGSVVVPPQIDVPVVNAPAPASYRLVEEAPYFELVKRLGQTVTDELLLNDDTVGFLNLSSENPTNDAINSVVAVDDGAGYAETGYADFMVVSTLKSSLSGRADHTKLLIESTADLAGIRIGSLAMIGREFVRVDDVSPTWSPFDLDDIYSITDVFADAALVTLGRGCLDTVPVGHLADEVIKFWGDVSSSDAVEHYLGEAVSVKLRARTAKGTLRTASSPVDIVAFNQRAVRPYPPGKLQINGDYGDILAIGDLTISWVDRDRIIQTTGVYEDFTAADIGPEIGVTYRLRAGLFDAAGTEVMVLADLDLGVVKTYAFNFDDYQFDIFRVLDVFALSDAFGSIVPENSAYVEFSVKSSREGLVCWQVPTIRALPFLAPSSLQVSSVQSITFLAPTNLNLQEIL